MMPAAHFYRVVGRCGTRAGEQREAVSNVLHLLREMTSPAKVDARRSTSSVGCIVPSSASATAEADGGRPLCRSQGPRCGRDELGQRRPSGCGPYGVDVSPPARVPARRFAASDLTFRLPRWLLRPGMTFGRCWVWVRPRRYLSLRGSRLLRSPLLRLEFHDRMCTQCISSRHTTRARAGPAIAASARTALVGATSMKTVGSTINLKFSYYGSSSSSSPPRVPPNTLSGCSAPRRGCTMCFSSPLLLFFLRFSHCGSPSSQ